MDIRNFFPAKSAQRKDTNPHNFTNITSKKKSKELSQLSKKKRRAVVIDSDSDEEPLPKKNTTTLKGSPPKSKLNLGVLQKVKSEPTILQKVSATDFFKTSKCEPTENVISSNDVAGETDEDFNKTLKQLDTKSRKPTHKEGKDYNEISKRQSPRKNLSQECKEAQIEMPKTPVKVNNTNVFSQRKSPRKKLNGSSNDSGKKLGDEIKKDDKHSFKNGDTTSVPVKTKVIEAPDLQKDLRKRIKTEVKEEPDERSGLNEITSQIDSAKSPKQNKLKEKNEQEIKTEKTPEKLNDSEIGKFGEITSGNKPKLNNSFNYRNYREREGPQALGSKEIPEGAENCLLGLTFLVTGILESLERDDAKDLVIKYGGKFMATLTKKTSFMVVGRDPGPAKMEKAEKFGTKIINEDEFLDLIRTRPGDKIKPKKLPSKMNAAVKKQMDDCLDPSETNQTKKYSDLGTESYKENLSKNSTPDLGLMWVDRYKPTSLNQVIGQHGDRSCARKLLTWLNKWQGLRDKGKNRPPGKWGAADDGSGCRAALLSGPPGIGKTTTAQLVCKEAGYEFIELNASDTRSKKTLQNEIAEVLQNKTISFDVEKIVQKHAIIFDEVDGMSGNEDRGGTQELIGLIKSSKIPIICICNDRAHPKIRSLANYCFDLRFLRPRVEQIKASMMSLLHKEKIKIPPEKLHEIIVASNQDLRQVLHHLSFLSSKDLGDCKDKKSAQKDVKLSPFDVLKKVFATEEAKSSVNDKASLFFHDYSLAPLFVHENYPSVKPVSTRGDMNMHLKLLQETAESISFGDIVDRTIRSQNNWSLLPTQAVFASVIPGSKMCGYLSQMIVFPSWLGKNSSRNHMDRVLQQLHMHTRLHISANKTELGLEYLPCLRNKIFEPLISEAGEGVRDALKVMECYYLLREDLDSVSELTNWPGQQNPMSLVQPKVKAALTRAFNKENFKNPYASISIKKGRKRSAEAGLDEDVNDDLDETDEEDVEDLSADAMVKQKKEPKKEPEAATSKGKGRGKHSAPGRGRGRGKK